MLRFTPRRSTVAAGTAAKRNIAAMTATTATGPVTCPTHGTLRETVCTT